MARSGMANPILRLRTMVDAGSADYTVNGVTYWTDDQLQTVLDQRRFDVFSEELQVIATNDGSGTARYYDYYCTPGEYEEGATVFQVTNSLGSAVTPDSINYQIGHVSFGTVDQHGTAYFLTARRFDLSGAAADVWRRKAAHVAKAYDFNADGQSLSRSQLMKQAMEMANLFAMQAEPMHAEIRRSDEP